jgi:hypothetical protein
MRTQQQIKSVKSPVRIHKTVLKKHPLKKNVKYHEGEEEFYKEYDEVEMLDEFFSEPDYLEDYLE